MNYSCFDPASGLYDYFEDATQIPINADLPVPQLPKAAGKIGVPSIDAGRPLPPGARPVGRGWHARGIVVSCGRGSPQSMGAMPTASGAVDWVKNGGWMWLLGGAVAVWFVSKETGR